MHYSSFILSSWSRGECFARRTIVEVNHADRDSHHRKITVIMCKKLYFDLEGSLCLIIATRACGIQKVVIFPSALMHPTT